MKINLLQSDQEEILFYFSTYINIYILDIEKVLEWNGLMS